MKKIKVKRMYLENQYSFRENAYQGEVLFTIGLHKYYTKFLTHIGVENAPIAFLQSAGQKIPQEKEMQEKVLMEIYGEFCKLLGQWEVQEYFIKQERERKEREYKMEEIQKSLENVWNAMKNFSKIFENALTNIALSDTIKTMKGEK